MITLLPTPLPATLTPCQSTPLTAETFQRWAVAAHEHLASPGDRALAQRYDAASAEVLRETPCPVCGSTALECPVDGRRRARINRYLTVGTTPVVPWVHLARKDAANTALNIARGVYKTSPSSLNWRTVKVFP